MWRIARDQLDERYGGLTIGELIDRYGGDDSQQADAREIDMDDRARPARSEFARLLAENERYTESFDRSALTAAPLSGLAIVACMDARLDVEEALGLRTGDAHIIRNAGGLATDDVDPLARSSASSSSGTDEIVVIGHTRCGLLGADEAAMREKLAAATGDDHRPRLRLVRATSRRRSAASVDRLRAHPWVRADGVHGLIFDVETGRLHEIG